MPSLFFVYPLAGRIDRSGTGFIFYVRNYWIYRTSEAGNILLNGLAGLEYRGYDSAGIAYFGNDSKHPSDQDCRKGSSIKRTCKTGKRLLFPLRHRPYPLGNPWRCYNRKRPSPSSGLVTRSIMVLLKIIISLQKNMMLKAICSQTDSEVAARCLKCPL